MWKRQLLKGTVTLRRILTATAFVLLASGCGRDSGSERPIPSSEAVAIETAGAGWFRVAAEDLIRAGLDPEIEVRRLGLFRRGAPVALAPLDAPSSTLGTSRGVEFWAELSDSDFTDTAVYWIGPTDDPLRVESIARPEEPASLAPLLARIREAPQNFYVISALNGPESNFFWDGVVALSGPAEKDFVVTARRPIPEGSFRLTAELYGLSQAPELDPDHHVRVALDGQPLGEAWFDGEANFTMVLEGPAAWLAAGANRVTLELPHDLGAARDTVLLRSLSLDYPREAAADDPGAALELWATEAGTYVVDGFAGDSAVYDLSEPARPRRLLTAAPLAMVPAGGEEVLPGQGGEPDAARVAFTVDPAPSLAARVLVVPPGGARPASAVRRSRAAEVLESSEGADLLIVAPDELWAAAERLARHRRENGTPARVVSWEAVVDAFGTGFPEPEAIAALLAHAATHWSPAPRFLLLMGDASYDPKGRLSEEPGGHQLPSFFTDTPFLETPTDNPFVAAGARDRPELAVGRFPAADLAEANAMVDKVLAYEGAAAGPWAERMLLVADDGESTWEWQLFHETSEALADSLPAPLAPVRIYVDELGGAGARAKLAEETAAGALWVNYLGHGSYTGWAAENLLDDGDVEALPASDALPVYVVMNCLTGYYAHPRWKLRSLGERLMITPERGAVAVIASTALAYPGGQAELNLALAGELLSDPGATLGEALLRAKAGLDPAIADHGDVIASWHLLGDPSMRLKRPETGQ